MIRNPLLPLLFLTVCLFPAAQATAQCGGQPVVPSGCPGAPAPTCSGAAVLGQTLSLTCPTNRGTVLAFLAVGNCASRSLMPPAVPTCGGATCTLAVDPVGAVIVNTGLNAVPIAVPNNQAFLGYSFCTQCISFEFVPVPCANVSAGISYQVR